MELLSTKDGAGTGTQAGFGTPPCIVNTHVAVGKYEVIIFMKKVPHVLPQPSGGAGARFLRPVEVFSGYRVFSDSLIPNSMHA